MSRLDRRYRRTVRRQRLRHREISNEIAIARERQVTNPLARGGKNRVAHGGDKRRYSWLAHTCGRRGAFREVDVGLSRNLVNPGDRVIIEIGLLDCAVLGSDLSAAHNACAENYRAFKLRARD